MYTIYTLTRSSLKLFVRNRQAFFFSFFMPMMILGIFGFMNFDKQSKIEVGLVKHVPTADTAEFLKQFKERQAEWFNFHEDTLQNELVHLNAGERAVVMDVPDNLFTVPVPSDPPAVTVYMTGSNQGESGAALSALSRAADGASLAIAGAKRVFTVESKTLSTGNLRYIDFLLPGVVAMAVMQMSVFSVAFVFAQNREKGILKRLMATPLRPYQFVTANIISRLTISVTQAAILIGVGKWLFHIHVIGQAWLIALCVVLGALMFLGMGFTVSGLAKSVDSVPVIANLTVFPMMFLGNVFFKTENAPVWLKPIANNLPLTFFARSLREVMTNGAGVQDILGPLLGMLIWAVVLVALATFTFRMQDKEAG